MRLHDKPRCWVEIDLGTLERNLKRIRSGLPDYIQYVAVVKADAYGHGMKQTVSRLMHCGADLFAVANLREAEEIREIGSGWPILILSAILPEEDKHIAKLQVIPTISCEEELERFQKAAQEAGKRISVHMKVDTGMGRIGVWYEDAKALCLKILECADLQLDGIFTHFSSADCDAAFTQLQRNRFLDLLKTLPLPTDRKLLIHCDNSAGLESLPRNGPLNGVRIGLLQFGVLPYPDSLLADVCVEPVLSFHTRVGLIKELPEGCYISYGKTYQLKKRSTIAVLTAGYADGIPTALSNEAEVLIRGKRCRVLGRVTMDQTIVDISDIPGVECGDIATLIGTQEGERISVNEFSSKAGEIPWESFVSISKRVQRIYKTDTGF